MAADAPCYMVANYIHDAEKYRVYEKGFFPILKKHGGSFTPSTTPPRPSKATTVGRGGS